MQAEDLAHQVADALVAAFEEDQNRWSGGLLAKSSWLDTTNPDYRQILQQYSLYNRALATNLPFPKTRKIVFLNNRPATQPGWAELTVG